MQCTQQEHWERLLQPATFEQAEDRLQALPATMKAAVYIGHQTVQVEDVATPCIGRGELLVRVEACGICHTDLKKIEYDLLPGPRVFGHETAGTVALVGEGVTDFTPGDRVAA